MNPRVYHQLTDLPLPPPNKPEFLLTILPDGWMEQFVDEVQAQYEIKADNDAVRVPLAAARCFRSGRTHILTELAHKLKKRDINTIFVTFDDYSPLAREEQSDPLGALLLRIAFAARKSERSKANFLKFRESGGQPSQHDISQWIGSSPCVLIIDDFDRLTELGVKGSQKAREFFEYLEHMFLSQSKRLFVFSSSVSSAMTLFGHDKVKVKILPTISSLEKFRGKLTVWGDESQVALYHGLLPGLMTGHQKSSYDQVINPELLEDVTWEMVRALLRSFLTGSVDGVHPIFLPFFDTLVVGDEKKEGDGQGAERMQSKWVMRHMSNLLGALSRRFRSNERDQWFLLSLEQLIRALLGKNGFEALFAFTYLTRVFVGSCSPAVFFPPALQQGNHQWSCSYNQFIEYKEKVRSWEQLRTLIIPPTKVTFPHMAYIIPSSAWFDKFHAFALFYDEQGNKIATYAFQVHVAGSIPKRSGAEDGIDKCFLVRGKVPVPSKESKSVREWLVVGQSDFDELVGVSGVDWAPLRLDALEAELGNDDE